MSYTEVYAVMARPIPPTPILSGEDAKEFLRLTRQEEAHPNPKRLKFLRECYETYLHFEK